MFAAFNKMNCYSEDNEMNCDSDGDKGDKSSSEDEDEEQYENHKRELHMKLWKELKESRKYSDDESTIKKILEKIDIGSITCDVINIIIDYYKTVLWLNIETFNKLKYNNILWHRHPTQIFHRFFRSSQTVMNDYLYFDDEILFCGTVELKKGECKKCIEIIGRKPLLLDCNSFEIAVKCGECKFATGRNYLNHEPLTIKNFIDAALVLVREYQKISEPADPSDFESGTSTTVNPVRLASLDHGSGPRATADHGSGAYLNIGICDIKMSSNNDVIIYVLID